MRVFFALLLCLISPHALAACDPGETRMAIAAADPKGSNPGARAVRGIASAIDGALNGKFCMEIVAVDPLAALVSGGAQIAVAPLEAVATVLPRWRTLGLPFAFRDARSFAAFFDEAEPELMRPDANMAPLAFLPTGFRQLATRRLVVTAEDLRGQRMASAAGDRDFFRAAGAPPQDVSNPASALLDGSVDGVSTDWRGLQALTRKRGDKGPALGHVLETNHLLSGEVIVASLEWRASLDAKTAKTVSDIVERVAASTNAYTQRLIKAARRTALRADLPVRLPTAKQRESWLRLARPIWQREVAAIGLPRLVERLDVADRLP